MKVFYLVCDDPVEARIFLKSVRDLIEVQAIERADFLNRSSSGRLDEGIYVLDLREHSDFRSTVLSQSFRRFENCEIWAWSQADSFYKRLFLKNGATLVFDDISGPLDFRAAVIGLGEGFSKSHKKLPEECKLDVSMQQIYHQGNSCGLSSTEFRIFMTLLETTEEHLRREEIRKRVWGADFNITVRSIDSHISRMRKKLPQPMEIVADRNRGYRLDLTA